MLPSSPMDSYSRGYAFILHLQPHNIGYPVSLNISFRHPATKLHSAPSRVDNSKPILCSSKRIALGLSADRYTSYIDDAIIPNQVSASLHTSGTASPMGNNHSLDFSTNILHRDMVRQLFISKGFYPLALDYLALIVFTVAFAFAAIKLHEKTLAKRLSG